MMMMVRWDEEGLVRPGATSEDKRRRSWRSFCRFGLGDDWERQMKMEVELEMEMG